MNELMTDLGRIAERIDGVVRCMASNSHSPVIGDISDSITITKNAWIDVAIELGRLSEYVKGLDQVHKAHREGVSTDV